MPTRGRFVCLVHCLVHDGAVRLSPCRPHHENFGRNLYHMFVPAYSASQSLFCFELWYSSCFEVKCWFHTFPKRCSHVPMWILIPLDSRSCHLNFFSPACFSSSGSDHFNIRKINSKFLNGVCFIRPKLSLFFPPSHPCFFKDPDFLIKYPCYRWKSLYSFPSMFLSGDSQEDTNGASS